MKLKICALIAIFIFLTASSFAFGFKKKDKAVILLSSTNPNISTEFDEYIKNEDVFSLNTRIYFLVYNKEGFKSNYIKYQIIKQDDNAHIGGYSRIRNITRRIKNRNYYTDYFVLSETGKYAIQIFDIENLHHWVAFAHFIVVDK